jgi:hypothetical protein
MPRRIHETLPKTGEQAKAHHNHKRNPKNKNQLPHSVSKVRLPQTPLKESPALTCPHHPAKLVVVTIMSRRAR